MAVTIKSEREIDLMRKSCQILAKVHNELGQAIEPGMSTLDIDRLGEKLIRGYGCVPNFIQEQIESFRRVISSALMQDLFIRGIIQMQQEPMALVR